MNAFTICVAWEVLHNCFENHRLLTTAHVDKLFAFFRVKRESASSLSSFVKTFRENVAVVKALGIEDTRIPGFFSFYLVTRVLDTKTKLFFEANLPQFEIQNLNRLLNFVAHGCKILENVGNNSSHKFIEKTKPTKPVLAATTS